MTSSRNQIIIAVAVLLGLLVVFLVNAYFSGLEQKSQNTAKANNLVTLVVAAQPLGFGTPITAENTRLVNWPANSVPAGAFRTTAGLINAARGQRVALRPIEAGEPILASKVSGDNGRATIATLLADGMRAASIRIDDVSGVGGFVIPGDVVDVLLTRQTPGEGADRNDQITDVVLEGVRVIGIDQLADENKTTPVVGKVATLEVSPVGAQKLALAQKVGTLSLALRNVTSLVQNEGGGPTIGQRDLGNGNWSYSPRSESPALAGLPPEYAPQYVMPAAPRVPAAPPAPRRPTGPTVEIIRGTEGATYEVKKYGH
ncbi:MAG: Flp pilus assembly protein CpaB [Sphingopyxis sp.]|jgi:pilus assembly protein CpaB|uniref:Flp pilus assembly protein CpaB n=1 Tax=Sphingopyxis sp. TaxID=1908224 RepID=UPI003D6C8B1C